MSSEHISLTTKTIREQIQRHGYISVADYMNAVATDYYARGDVFGRGGDFVTAPEISQAFGEIVGLWAAVTWQQMGSPRHVHLVECGPGRGTLMADALRATKGAHGFVTAAKIHLVERSPALRALQKKTLSNHDITWHDDLATVPDGPVIIIGNEFLDALPVRQYQRTNDGWAERVITLDGRGELTFSTRPADNIPIPIPLAVTAEVGAIFEFSEAITALVKHIANRIARNSGAALLIDYGHSASGLGDTLQAVKGHSYRNVLTSPGEADMTAHVDFAHVKAMAKSAGVCVFGPIEQGIWLRQLGIGLRQVQLARGKPADVAQTIEQGVRRLTEPHGMGVLFKVITLADPSLPRLEGFP